MEPIRTRICEKSGKVISAPERQYRLNYDKTGRNIQGIPSCIICHRNLSSNVAMERDIFTHPHLNVLMCKNCYVRHRKSDFGSHKLCSCCGLTGKFKSCTKCASHFCTKCLEFNLEKQIYDEVVNSVNWECLICFPKPLWQQRAICAIVLDKLLNQSSGVSRKRLRTLSTDKPVMKNLKRKRSNSLGDKYNGNNNNCRESIINELQQFATEHGIQKVPTEEDFAAIKEELLCKADELSLLSNEINGRLTDFKEKVMLQNFNQKVLQKMFSFESELINTTIKTLNFWKNKLNDIGEKWYKDFKIALHPTENTQTNEDQNCNVIKNSCKTNEDYQRLSNEKKKRKTYNLSLKKTFDTQMTDDEFGNDVDHSSISVIMSEPHDADSFAGDLNSLLSTNRVDERNTEVPNEVAVAPPKDSSVAFENNSDIQNSTETDSDHSSIASDVTELINPDDYQLLSHNEINENVIIKLENEEPEQELMLSEVNGCVVSSQNAAIIDDDTESEKSFIFDLSGYISELSPNNGIEESHSKSENKESTVENDMEASANKEPIENHCIPCETTPKDSTDQPEKLKVPETKDKKEIATNSEPQESTDVNSDAQGSDVTNLHQHNNEIKNSEKDNQISKWNDPCIPYIRNANAPQLEEDGEDDIFSESSDRVQSVEFDENPISQDEKQATEDLQAKMQFFESLELSAKDVLSLDKTDIEDDYISRKLSQPSREEGSEEDTEDSDCDGIKQAVKLLQDDDSDVFTSDMEVSNSNSDEEMEEECEQVTSKDNENLYVGVIIHQLPALPSEEDIPNSPANTAEGLIISTSDNSDNELDIDINVKYNIKSCCVILERLNKSPEQTMNESSKTASNTDNSRDIERLTNLNNLETNHKIDEQNAKKIRRKRKIIKPSGSPGSRSESYESDSDCDSIIPSSLPIDDEDMECSRSYGSPASISHNMSLITPDDMLDHLINAIISDTDVDASAEDSDNDEADSRTPKKKLKRTGSTDSNKENKPVKQEINDNNVKQLTSNENTTENKWRNDQLLRGTLSDSESDGIVEGDNILSEKTKLKMEKLEKRMLNRDIEPAPIDAKIDSDKDLNLSSDDDIYATKDVLANEIIISTDADSDIEFISETKKKTLKSPKKSAICIFSDDGDDCSSSKSESESDSAKKKGRRNIRAILSDETLEEATKRANLVEKQRKDRLSQKQKNMDSFLSQSMHVSQEEGLILDVDESTNSPSIIVHSKLTKRLKPHQVAGVKFMWESCYEGVKQLQQDSGSGCILAHCMGLGKTFQVVTLIHTLFAHEITKTKYVMVVCPMSIVLNWENEFNKGLEGLNDGIDIEIFCISDGVSTREQRLFIVEKWRQKSGILIMGYEAYEKLTKCKQPGNPTLQEKNIKKILVNPGPNLVVLDEGHLLKNGKNIRTKALMNVKTKRRIILTGTPLQNNLKEYYYMVQFVKPNLLGSYHEYTNRFVNPITNGQYDDSTAADIVQMKKRSHVLHKMLRNTIQRYEVSELRSYLPERFDYVLFIQLDPLQAQLYEKFIDLVKERDILKRQFFNNYNKLQVICTHPYLLYLREEKEKTKRQKKENKEPEAVNTNPMTNVDPEINHVQQIADGWWHSLCPEDYKTNINYGPKFKVMLSIIQECEKIGDKILIFSNSIIELDAIEFFLQQHETPTSQWKPKQDFYRMDGNVATETRLQLCNSFNDKNNKRTRVFLISKVGRLGLNLVAANRVILMDVGWNPAFDSQSVFRVYRFGQEKQCYIYRLVSMGTMEEVVYERQVTKLSIAGRVVDELQITRHYNSKDMQKMYRLNFKIDQERPPLHVPIDTVLATVLQSRTEIFKYHEHQAMLENLPEEELNEDEMKLAWDEFNKENENRNHLIEQQRKRVTGVQPSTSGVNTFLPSHFNKTNITPTAEMLHNIAQLMQQNNISMDPQPVNQLNNNKFLPHKPYRNKASSNTDKHPEVSFETVFITDYHKQVFNAEDATKLHSNHTQQQKAGSSNIGTELQMKYLQWISENPSLQTTPNTSVKLHDGSIKLTSDSSKNSTSTASSHQYKTSKVPKTANVTNTVITNVSGAASLQKNTPTIPVIIPTSKAASHQNKTPIIPKTANAANASCSHNNTPTIPIITSVSGAFSPQIPVITSITGTSPHQSSTPKVINVTSAATLQSNTSTISKISNVTDASSLKSAAPATQKVTRTNESFSSPKPFVYKNRSSKITMTKIVNGAPKEKGSSMVVNPANSSNAVTLTRRSKNVQHIKDEISHSTKTLTRIKKTSPPKTVTNEQRELLRSLNENLDITLSPLSRARGEQPSSSVRRNTTLEVTEKRSSSHQLNKDDVIEIDD